MCFVYLDDVIVFSRTLEEHFKHLDAVLSLLRSAGISSKLRTCEFFQRKVRFLGHVISPGKLRVAAEAAFSFSDAMFQ